MTHEPPRDRLAARGLAPKRHFGQNFMADANIARQIAELATTPPGGTVVEIGAGLGALTRELLARAGRVVAIERDRDLVPALREDFAGTPSHQLEILEADAKSADYAQLFSAGPEPRVLAGNLPYHLTGPLLQITVGLSPIVTRAVFLVQLEVADRIAAPADSSEYGALSVFVQAAFTPRRAFIVRRGAFYPQPRVDSAVVVLTRREDAVAETPVFRDLVHAAFAQRRKTLRNAWRGLRAGDAAAIQTAASRAGIDLDARGETLDVAAFARMAAELER